MFWFLVEKILSAVMEVSNPTCSGTNNLEKLIHFDQDNSNTNFKCYLLWEKSLTYFFS